MTADCKLNLQVLLGVAERFSDGVSVFVCIQGRDEKETCTCQQVIWVLIMNPSLVTRWLKCS